MGRDRKHVENRPSFPPLLLEKEVLGAADAPRGEEERLRPLGSTEILQSESSVLFLDLLDLALGGAPPDERLGDVGSAAEAVEPAGRSGSEWSGETEDEDEYETRSNRDHRGGLSHLSVTVVAVYCPTVLLSESPRIEPVHRRILALAFLGWMFDFYDLILYTFLTRPISDELHLSRWDHSLALGLSFFATAVGGVGGGLLADRFGRRRMISWTILLYSAGSLFSGLATSRDTLFLARFITGVGGGGEGAAGHSLVPATLPPSTRR